MGDTKPLSTGHIISIARAHFRKFSFDDHVDVCILNNFFSCASFGLSVKEIKDVELAILLLASAEKVSYRQYDKASKLLKLCGFLSSNTGNSVQRLVHYFTRSLEEKINRETGIPASNSAGSREGEIRQQTQTLVLPNASLIECYKKISFAHVMKFPAIQAVLDNVASARKIHYIDLSIRTGCVCMVLMDALASREECPLELFKVTALGTTSREEIAETGKRLASAANDIKLPFSFNIVMVKHIKEISVENFELHDDEAIAIFSWCVLRYTLPQPGCLESVLRVFNRLNPCILVAIEVEANHLSPIFMDRFSDALSYWGFFFDCVEDSMDRCDPNRMALEALCLGRDIQNTITAEDGDQILWHMKIDGWRTRFSNFGLVEAELSSNSLLQAEWLTKMSDLGNCCTINTNGKSMIVNWKGTPITSLSAWKFTGRKDQRQNRSIKCKALGL